MVMILSPDKLTLRVVCRHYTNLPLWKWLECWSREEYSSLYLVEGDYSSHPSSYGSSWVEVELTLPMHKELPYVEDVSNSQSLGGWSVDWNRNWFHSDRQYIKILGTSC